MFSTKRPHFLDKRGAEDGNSGETGGAVFSKDERSFNLTLYFLFELFFETSGGK